MKRMSKLICIVLSMIMLVSVLSAGLTAFAETYYWAGCWGTSAIDSGITIGGNNLKDIIPANSTVRTVLVPTLSGTKIRLKFSNLYGDGPVTINETTIAKTGETDDLVVENTITQVTFNGGRKSVTIAAGSEILSDEISFKTTALEKVSVSCYYKKTTTMYTIGLYGATAYLSSALGNKTQTAELSRVATKLDFTSSTITYHTIPFLTRLDVYSPNAYTVVLLGDSTFTNEISQMLAEKVHANGIHNVGFVMSGIIGNKLLSDDSGLLGTVYGQNLLDRAKRDAFNIPGVKYVLVKIGINDVLHPMLKSNEGKMPLMTADKVIEGYKQLSAQTKDTGIKLYLCTRTPYKGYTRNFMGSADLEWKQEGEDTLQAINKWVMNNCTDFGYAGYINLDGIRDPEDPAQLRPHVTEDGAHFNQMGQIIVTDLIPEISYGITWELKDYADIKQVDPYKAPVKPVETTTKKPVAETTTKKDTAETTTASQTTTKPAPQTQATTNPPILIQNPETTTNGANQILMNNNPNNNQNVDNAGIVSDNTSSAKQMIGFGILAAVAIAIIAFAAVMITRLVPSASAPLTKGKGGRANQKKKV